ncbi:MAG: hypothetical protein ACK4UN_21625, partial [Limisphaerales bacterium]
VVALLFAVFWKRFTSAAVLCTLIGGMFAVILSMVYPQIISPFAHGIPMGEGSGTLVDGMRQHQFMRAFYGVVVCIFIAVIVTLFTRPEPKERQRGLVWGTIKDALFHYKGAPGVENTPTVATAIPSNSGATPVYQGEGKLPSVSISQELANSLKAAAGDLLYVSDARWWTGGLHSAHVIVSDLHTSQDLGEIVLDSTTYQQVAGKRAKHHPIRVERLY